MTKYKGNSEHIIELLRTKACMKQDVYQITQEVFADFKLLLKEQESKLNLSLDSKCKKAIEIEYKDRGDHLAELKFASDILIFGMHTNVFNFENSHYINKTSYVQKDPYNAYCGVINIYNFIADSFKFNRTEDLGYLIARVFINKEGHFFLEGKKELGRKYDNFVESKIDTSNITDIIESCILHAMNFDLRTPPYYLVSELSVNQMLEAQNNLNITTAKRLGFKFTNEIDKKVK